MTHWALYYNGDIAMFKPLILSAALLTLSATALGQQAPPAGFNGSVVGYTDNSVTLKDKDGKDVTVAMTPGWFVSSPKKITADAVKTGDFVATANTNIDANTGKSTELRIMEPNYRPEEGTHLMGGRENVSMTHGTVKKLSEYTTSSSRPLAPLESFFTVPWVMETFSRPPIRWVPSSGR